MENGYITYFGFKIYDENSKQAYNYNTPLEINSVPILSKNSNIPAYAFISPFYSKDLLSQNVMVRGIKNIKLNNGESIYVSDDRAIMSINDPRILKIKEKYFLENRNFPKITILGLFIRYLKFFNRRN